MPIPRELDSAFRALKRAYPDGVPERDYYSLLLILREDMAEQSIGIVGAELIGGEAIVVENDAAAAAGLHHPAESDVERVRAHLAANGWVPELPPE